MAKLPRVKPGDEITAELFNLLLEAAERCRIEPGVGIQVNDDPAGLVLSATVRHTFDAQITGPISSGTYPWTEQFPAASGGWTVGSRTGVAYERNDNASVPDDTYVEMRWTSAGYYEFEAGDCP